MGLVFNIFTLGPLDKPQHTPIFAWMTHTGHPILTYRNLFTIGN